MEYEHPQLGRYLEKFKAEPENVTWQSIPSRKTFDDTSAMDFYFFTDKMYA
jgi:hypothetical protein